MEVSRLWGRVGLNYDDVRDGARRVTGLLGGLKSTFLTLGTQAASTAAGFLIRDVVIGSWNRLNQAIRQTSAEMIGANRQWEQFETQFATLLKSEDAALQRLSELERFGILTPFNLDQVIEADILLQNFGLHAENAAQRFGKSGEDIRRIAGDTAAGVKTGFTEIAMWLGRFAAGDTGQAIMRMQELGVTTRQELAAMGVEFNKAGTMTSPVDQAMTALLRIMEEKFGGLMEVQSQTLGGMESNLEDWMDRQKRLWGEPVAESYKSHLQDLLGFLDSEMAASWMDTGRELFASAVGWLDDVLVEWGHKLGQLAVDAFEWGANIVRQFASGIEGSGYVADALQQIADDIAYWLMPGSPPRLLPDLPEWGRGALEAYLSGWEGVQTGDVQSYLADALKSLEPFLRDGIFSDDERAKMQEAFGGRADIFEGYVTAQARLRSAASETAAARLALQEAEESGDQDAIQAAKDRLELAETEERAANDRVREEERRVAQRLEAEFALAKAIQQQTDAVNERDQREAKAHADAQARAAEAEARAIKQAKLRWELAVAETPTGQLSIWERELAAAQEGSAEWYDIATHVVQLQQRIRDEAARGGAGTGTFGASLLAPPTEEEITNFQEDFDQTVHKVDWGTIGGTIAGALWTGFKTWVVDNAKEYLDQIAKTAKEWATDQDVLDRFYGYGSDLVTGLLGGFRSPLEDPENREEMGKSFYEFFKAALVSIDQLLGELMYAAINGAIDAATAEVWRGLGFDTPPEGGLIGVWSRGAAEAINDAADVISGDPSRFASGTSYAPGGWALVGEQGPELVSLPRGSQVLPATDTARAMQGQGNTINITIHAPNGDAREVEIGVMRGLRAAGVY